MMTHQHDYGTEYTIPIYVWYLEGGDMKILLDTGLIGVIQSEEREKSIGGKIYTFEEGLARWNLTPADIDIVIHTHLHNDHCENVSNVLMQSFTLMKWSLNQPIILIPLIFDIWLIFCFLYTNPDSPP